MSAIRNILQRCVRNASILGHPQLRLKHSGSFCPIYSDPTYISRKAYSNTVNEAAENATHSAQESPFGKADPMTSLPNDILDDQKIEKTPDSMTSQPNDILDDQRAALVPSSSKNLNLRKYFINIRDLSKETTPESLREFYSQFGEIASCDVILQGKSKQFGSVAFTSKEAAMNSLPHCIDGKEIKVIPTMLSKKHLTLQVLDLAPETTTESLKTFYSTFGSLKSWRINKRATGIGQVVGEVIFSTQKDMHSALDAQPHVIDGSEVFLQYSTFDLDLWILKMPEGVTEESLHAFYSKYGQLRACRLREGLHGLTHGYVSYSALDEVNRAMDDRPHIIGGKPLQIRFISQGEDKVSLFVGSLPENVTEETLREEFSKYGKPVFWEVQNDGRFDQSGAYGIVSYATEEEALKALNSGPHTIEGTVVENDERKATEMTSLSKEKNDN
ncbi:RNA recognition motif domain-containing protein [Ditylenchus destructor]|nr:RNA recognition motif domain-containing protein [Ditylenchus destructor]